MEIANRPEIIIVDQNDSILNYKKRGTLNKDDIYRVSGLWVTNSRGDILLAKRHHTKIHNPNKWGPAVSGTVEKGETYESNIIKETEEEIGLKNVKLKLGPKTETDSEYHHFTQWYFLNIDLDIDDFKIKEDEVEEIKWFSPEWLKTRLEKYPDEFVPRMDYYFKTFSLPD